MEIRKIDDLCPDKVRLIVDWDDMVVGRSVFVPCINVKQAVEQVQEIFKRKGWKARVCVNIEHNILGIRIWRIA